MPEVVRRRHKRPRPQTSCRICHQRKVRCNRELPCDQCIKHRCPHDCQYDGIPAKQGETPNTPGCSSNASLSRSSDDGSFTSDTMANLGNIFGSSSAFENNFNADESFTANPNQGSRLPAHQWSNGRLTRGRTHHSWLLEEFSALKAHVDQAASDVGNCGDMNILMRRKHDLLRQRVSAMNDLSSPMNVYEELPPVAVSCDLVFRYFETFDTVYPILDRDNFGKSFNAMLAHPTSVPICFIIQVLVMQALANATYPDDQAPIPRAAVIRWLDLAISTPGPATEVDELDVELIRLYALVILARQVLRYNETCDDILSCSCVRAAMTLGLHRIKRDDPTAMPGCGDLHTLWQMIQDLELQACLAAGMVPTTPIPNTYHVRTNHDSGQFPLHTARDSRTCMSDMLSSSLHIRHKIVSTLNSEQDLYFEKVVHLSRELTRSMAPISTLEALPKSLRTFEHQYVSFVYSRFLIALHRPFATLDDPAFYWSRTLCVRLSKQYIEELFTNFDRRNEPDLFGTLLIGHGSMFGVQALQAIMVLCYELYREEDEGTGMPSMVQSEEIAKMDIKRMLVDLLPFGEKMMRTYEHEGRSFLLPYMVLAHLDAVRQLPKGSDAYNQSLAGAATAAVEQCFALWPQLDLHQTGFA